MASGNADLIRPIYEEWGRGNWRTSFDVYDEHMEWGWSDEFPGLGGVCEDHQDPNPRLRAWLSGWEDWRAKAEDFLEIGDYVIVLASYHGRGKGSGVEIRQEGAHVFKLRDGKVVRLEIFATRAKAIESVHAVLDAPRAQRDTPQPRAHPDIPQPRTHPGTPQPRAHPDTPQPRTHPDIPQPRTHPDTSHCQGKLWL